MTRDDYVQFLVWLEENCDQHPDGWTTTSDYTTVLSANEVVDIYIDSNDTSCCSECGTIIS